MPAYLVAYEEEMGDPVILNEYGAGPTRPSVAHGARFLASGSRYEVLEGSRRPELLGVVEFPSLAEAHAWYHSPEHAEAKPLRHQASRSNMLLIEGR